MIVSSSLYFSLSLFFSISLYREKEVDGTSWESMWRIGGYRGLFCRDVNVFVISFPTFLYPLEYRFVENWWNKPTLIRDQQ